MTRILRIFLGLQQSTPENGTIVTIYSQREVDRKW